jgi:quercetin dioxygenase-like cupin family protein
VRRLLVPTIALAVGLVLGATGEAVLNDEAEAPDIRGSGTLADLPRPPLAVKAETVRLRRGFRSRHYHPGPTFNLVREGEVEIIEQGRRRRYGPGELFFEEARAVHTIVVLESARLDVLRLLPPGAPGTIEVEPR